MKRLSFICGCMLTIGSLTLSGCDDDAGDDTGMDVVEDTHDAGSDIGEDVTEDVGPRCGDGVVDSDEECEPGVLSGETCAELLDIAGAFGRFSCTDDCEWDTSGCFGEVCDGDDEFVGGSCEPPLGTDGYVAHRLTYVSAARIAETSAPCCYDFDNNGVEDTAISGLLSTLAAIGDGVADINGAMQARIDNGTLVTLVDFVGLPDSGISGEGPAMIRIFDATNDRDSDGSADQSVEERGDGDGVFLIENARESNRAQFNVATHTQGDVQSDASQIPIPFPLPGHDEMTVSLELAYARAELIDIDGGLHSVNRTATVGGSEVTLGGFEIGGYILLTSFEETLNRIIDDCSCAGISEGTDLLTITEGARAMSATCDPGIDVSGSANCSGEAVPGDGLVCPLLSQLCLVTAAITGTADVDTNGNGVRDAVSVGFHFELVPAALGPAIVDDAQ